MLNLKVWRNIIKIDGLLIQISILCLIVLVFSQFFLLFDFSRPYFSRLDKLEGDSILSEQAVSENVPVVKKSAKIRVAMTQPQSNSRVFLTVNGQVAGNFASGDVTIMIFDGDIIEIDARLYPNLSKYAIEITDTTTPLSKKNIIVKKLSIGSLGIIHLKDN